MNTNLKAVNDDRLVELMEEQLPHDPSPIMDFRDAIITKAGENRYLYGYLINDDAPENPLEDWDGVGRIYSAHRDSDTHEEMQEALGLDRNWERDIEIALDYPDVFRRHWIEKAAEDADFQQWCYEEGRPPVEEEKRPAYYRNKATRFWRDTGGCGTRYTGSNMDYADFETVTDLALESAFDELLETGEIGEPDCVMLDCYQHSGIAWSISGEGMQCTFDTANGAGVWVPDEICREEIDRRSQVLAFGQVVRLTGLGAKKAKPYFFRLDEEFGGTESVRFEYWHEAFEALQKCLKENKIRLPRKKQKRQQLLGKGRYRASIELARGAVELYNNYLNGNVFGRVILTFETKERDGSPELVEDELCFGFYGDDDAMEALEVDISEQVD